MKRARSAMTYIPIKLDHLSSEEKRDLLARLLQKQANQPKHFPLSFVQQQVWQLKQLEPTNPLYNVFVAYRLIGPLNVAALEQSFNEIVRRHEILRSTFTTTNGCPVQVVHPALFVPLSLADLRDVPEAAREAEVRRLATEEALRHFDLSEGPLLRTTLVRLDTEEHVLLRCIHRIVVDGWSLGIMALELGKLYEAFSSGQASTLPELPIQYADFVLAQQSLPADLQKSHLAYWQERLSDAPALIDSLAVRPRPATHTHHGARHRFDIPRDLIAALKGLGQQAGVSLFVVMLTAFKVLLYRRTGQEDIVVGSPVACRERRELQGLIGLFATALILRTDLSHNPTFLALLRRVCDVVLGAYDHQDADFGQIFGSMEKSERQQPQELLQVVFALQSIPLPSTTSVLSNLSASYLKTDEVIAKTGLSLFIWERSDKPTGEFEYNTSLFDAQSIRHFADAYLKILERCVEQPDARISDM
jgi:non-ribosomal peptide synthetase component F